MKSAQKSLSDAWNLSSSGWPCSLSLTPPYFRVYAQQKVPTKYLMKKYPEKVIWVFVYRDMKYGKKFVAFYLIFFVKHKPWNWEEYKLTFDKKNENKNYVTWKIETCIVFFTFGVCVCDFDYITENWYFDKCEKVYDKCNCHFYKHHKCQLTFILQINQMLGTKSFYYYIIIRSCISDSVCD